MSKSIGEEIREEIKGVAEYLARKPRRLIISDEDFNALKQIVLSGSDVPLLRLINKDDPNQFNFYHSAVLNARDGDTPPSISPYGSKMYDDFGWSYIDVVVIDSGEGKSGIYHAFLAKKSGEKS